ncbi:flavin reductase family protein [Pseudochelatococcus sp. B33]
MSDTMKIVPFPTERRPQTGEGAAAGGAVDSVLFKQGMRRLAAGVSIVATEFEGKRYGLVATAVSSVSADPPTLLVCVSQSASARDFIARSGRFSVNVLRAQDRAVAEKFSLPALRARRFEFGEWTTLHTGAPVLATALAGFDCLVAEEARVASHTVFFGRVVGVHVHEGAVDPLLFWNGAYQTGEPDES